MKTFVSNDYQVTLRDNGGVKVFTNNGLMSSRIIYDPESKPSWSYQVIGLNYEESNSITGLELPTWKLKILREALKVVDKQDLFDKEIVFLDEEK